MNNWFLRLIRGVWEFLWPGGLVLVAAFVAVRYGFVDSWLPRAERILPYAVVGVGVLLSWRFHRSRLAFVILILVLAERILHYFGPGGLFLSGNEELVLKSVAILLPVNMFLFYLVKERGLFNLRGGIRFAFILCQPLVVVFLFHTQPWIFMYFDYQFIDYVLPVGFDLSQPVLLVHGAVTVIFFIGSLVGRGPILRGFFWAQLAILTAFSAYGGKGSVTFYFSLAGIIIILAVIEAAYAMAFRDELTGLPARRALSSTLLGLGRCYTIAMVDIDFFKKFNDTYGHDVGDQVLRMVASYLERVGGGGRSFRYGGEEFTIVFSGKDAEEAIPHLEKLREDIAKARFTLRGNSRPKKVRGKGKKISNSVAVTVSIGAAMPGGDRTKPADVIKAADKALYRAKKKGRNQVVS